jgi:eukaryotic-like serine/threonine-protein kinase
VSTAPKRQPIPFGKYLLLDRVNIGGMAEVWRAKTFGAGGFERIVAIKRILPNIAEDEEFISMFLDEAKITVQLNHANIAQIYELNNLSNSYFIAMEYVSGKDLRAVFDRCRKRGEPAPIPLTCFAIAQCCEGLDYAHRAKDRQGRDMGIVHRDVSPQNALISYDGEVKVIDFGIAKAAGKATKTQAGILKGKFGYMSPEQIRGLPLDGRSDIFAIGVCLYEMLTGERLFVGDSDFSVLEKVRKVEVLPPSHFNRKIPDALERIVMKSLAKDVDDRYQHATELAEDLRGFMYSTGNAFARKDLAAFMKATFAEDYEKERARIQEYAEVKAPEGMLAAAEMGFGVGPVPNNAGSAQSPSAITNVPTQMPISSSPSQHGGTSPGLPPCCGRCRPRSRLR